MSRPDGATGAPLETGTSGPNGHRGNWWARSGLVARIAFSAIAVSAGLAVVFAVLFLAITGLRHRSLQARHSQQVIAAANQLQTLVIDLETGLRGFIITNDERQLAPWNDARAQYPTVMRTLLRLTTDSRLQHKRAMSIRRAIDTYLQTFSLPLVEFLRRNPNATQIVIREGRGSRQVSQIRDRFDIFLATER